MNTNNQLKKYIKKSKAIFIMAHRNLDLDAIGSAIVLCQVVLKKKRRCYLIIDDENHEKGVAKVLHEQEGCINILKSSEVEKHMYKVAAKNFLIILDTNKTDLVQNKQILDKFKNRIIIDHHEPGKTTIKNNTLTWIDENASSTCEIISNLIWKYKLHLDPYYYTLLLSGIVLDTNNFILKTTEETFYTAYKLVALGASVKKVQYLLKQDIKEYVERQKLLTNVKMINGNIAITKATPYTIYHREDLAKIADTLLFFNDIEASFVIGKIADDVIGVSARSMGNFNLLPVLEKIGGGGDEMGGAAKFEKTTISKVEERLKKAIAKK